MINLSFPIGSLDSLIVALGVERESELMVDEEEGEEVRKSHKELRLGESVISSKREEGEGAW
jgi:hypothetical protein